MYNVFRWYILTEKIFGGHFMAVASLVLGIIALCLSIGIGAAGMGWIGSICGIVGIVLAAITLKKGKDGRATAGLVLSIIALSWGVISTIACLACLGAIGGMGNNIYY